jgi:hypothetical protein
MTKDDRRSQDVTVIAECHSGARAGDREEAPIGEYISQPSKIQIVNFWLNTSETHLGLRTPNQLDPINQNDNR